jgi:hypothetical protein
MRCDETGDGYDYFWPVEYYNGEFMGIEARQRNQRED